MSCEHLTDVIVNAGTQCVHDGIAYPAGAVVADVPNPTAADWIANGWATYAASGTDEIQHVVINGGGPTVWTLALDGQPTAKLSDNAQPAACGCAVHSSYLFVVAVITPCAVALLTVSAKLTSLIPLASRL